MKIGGVGWDNADVGGSNVDFKEIMMKLKDGTNVVRLLDKNLAIQYYQHWQVEARNGEKIHCKCALENCPACLSGNRPQVRWYLRVWDYASDSPKILTIPRTIFRSIRAEVMEEGIDLTANKMKIKRFTAGQMTQYNLSFSPAADFTPEQLEKIKRFKSEVTEDVLPVSSTVDQVNRMMGIIGDYADDEDDEVPFGGVPSPPARQDSEYYEESEEKEAKELTQSLQRSSDRGTNRKETTPSSTVDELDDLDIEDIDLSDLDI